MKRETLSVAIALTGTAIFGPAAQACNTLIVWQADLTAQTASPATPNMATLSTAATSALGKATVEFDFVHPGATFRVETKAPRDVQQISLHITRTFSSPTGPTLFILYSATDGPLPAIYAKRVGEADLLKQPTLKIMTLADAVHAVLDGRAYVTVTPKGAPKVASRTVTSPELSGFITMRKEEVYSDQPGDAVHDPALHHAASASAITP